MKFFDSHAHLDDEKFNEDREHLIKEIKESGIDKFISAGYSLEGSKRGIELANKYDFIYTTSGISPNDIPQTEEELWITLEKIEKMILEQNRKIDDLSDKITEKLEDDKKYRHTNNIAIIIGVVTTVIAMVGIYYATISTITDIFGFMQK